MNVDCSEPSIVMTLLETKKIKQQKIKICLCEIAMQREIFLFCFTICGLILKRYIRDTFHLNI
jgi:hypothetical protein